MAITGRAVLLAALCAPLAWLAAPLGGWDVSLALTGAVVVLILIDIALAASPRRVGLTHDGDTSVRLGESASVRLVIVNAAGRRLRATVRDAWPPSAHATPRVHTVDVPAGRRRAVGMNLTPSRRGDQRASGVTIRSLGPLGLGARQATHAAEWTVRGLPPFKSRRHLPGKLTRLRELDGQQRALVRGQGSEFDSLREYIPGDDVRSIDWRATARSTSMVVRTWRPERDRRILLVLDTSRTSAGRVGDTPRLDHSMDAALLLATLAGKAGDRVDLLAYDRQPRARVEAHGRGSSVEALVRAMAPLEPELLELNAPGLVTSVLTSQPKQRHLVVLLTDLNASALEDGLLPRLPALTARHLLLVAAVSDPRVEAMAQGRGDARSVYEAAAAEHTRAERRRLTAELQRHGVEVVDAPPEKIAPALADAYIELKAAGRL